MKDCVGKGFGTIAVHGGQEPDPGTGAVMTPIYQTSTYAQKSPGEHQGYDYSRADNPTRKVYEDSLATLEGAKYGLSFSSGLAAVDTILRTSQSGDHVICCDDVYGGTYRLFTKVFERFGLEFSFLDLTNLDQVKRAFKANTKILWIETPTNPLLKIFDIKALSRLARGNGALTVVDNTFLSPYFQRPLELGADISVHSVTKYLSGHSDLIGGALMTNDVSLYEPLKFLQMAVGAVPSPTECFLALRGIKTLHLRMSRHDENARILAAFLEKNEKIKKVIYPGLESHPNHALAKSQMSGFGGMISFYLKCGLVETKNFLKDLDLFTLAESLGGVESLIEHPAIMTHASVPPETREELGITDSFIRLSVGIEDVEDLQNDLELALQRL